MFYIYAVAPIGARTREPQLDMMLRWQQVGISYTLDEQKGTSKITSRWHFQVWNTFQRNNSGL